MGRAAGAWVRGSCSWIQFVPGGVRFYEQKVVVVLSSHLVVASHLLAPSVAAQLFRCFGLLDAGPYRLEGRGVTSRLILLLGLMGGSGRKSQR